MTILQLCLCFVEYGHLTKKPEIPLYYSSQILLKPTLVAGPSGRAVKGVGLRPLACWGRGFESQSGHGYLSVLSVVCCQVDVSATGLSLVLRSPTNCGASLCVI